MKDDDTNHLFFFTLTESVSLLAPTPTITHLVVVFLAEARLA